MKDKQHPLAPRWTRGGGRVSHVSGRDAGAMEQEDAPGCGMRSCPSRGMVRCTTGLKDRREVVVVVETDVDPAKRGTRPE